MSHVCRCRGIMIAMLCLFLHIELRPIEAKVKLVKLSLQNARPYEVVMSDGSITQTDTIQYPCGIGSGLLFIRDSQGVCYDETAFKIIRGTVNQWSSNPARILYPSRQYTFIEASLLDGYTNSEKSALFKALLKSTKLERSEVTIVGVELSTGTLGPLFTSTIQVGSRISTSTGWLCSVTSGICRTSWEAVTQETYILAKGVGTIGVLVYQNRSQTCPGYANCVYGILDNYLPSSTGSPNAVPIGITYRSFWENGAQSEYNKGEPTGDVDYVNGTRTKRFIGFVLYGTNQVLLNALDESYKAGLRAAQANDEALTNDNLKDQQMKQKLEIVMNKITASTVQMDYTYKPVNDLVEVQDHILRYLVSKSEAIESYTLYIVPRIATLGTANELALQQADKRVNDSYPGWFIVEKYISPTEIDYLISDGHLLANGEGNCGQTMCYLEGHWTRYVREGTIEELDYPLIPLMGCGIYFSTTDPTAKAVIQSKASIALAKEYILSRGIRHTYSLERECADEKPIQAKTFGKLNEIFKQYQIGEIQAKDDGFFLNCQNATGLYANHSMCGSYVANSNALIALEKFQPEKLKMDNAIDAYMGAMNKTGPMAELLAGTEKDAKEALSKTLAIPKGAVDFLDNGITFKLPAIAIAALVLSIIGILMAGTIWYMLSGLARNGGTITFAKKLDRDELPSGLPMGGSGGGDEESPAIDGLPMASK